jgi:hypothetical protein
MVVMNCSSETRSLALERFSERTDGYRTAREQPSGRSWPLEGTWELQPYESRVLELQP